VTPRKDYTCQENQSKLSNISSICNQIYNADCFEYIYIALGGVLDKANMPTLTGKRVTSNKNIETLYKKIFYYKNQELMKSIYVNKS